MKQTYQPKRDELSLTAVLYALSDPVRLEIVRQLAREGEKTCGAFAVEMPKSSLSHHFRVLRQSGVIASRQSGTQVFNELRRADLEARFPGVLKSVLKSVE